jgi:phosphomevalonate kinase
MVYMLYSAIVYAGAGSLIGVAVVLAGVPFLRVTCASETSTKVVRERSSIHNIR